MGRYQTEDDLSAVSEAIVADEAEHETVLTADEESPEDQTDAAEVGEETPAETEGDEPEGQDSEEETEEPTFTVMVDGVETDVPLSELTKGYMRTADYTRKTQLLGSQRRQLEDANNLMVALERNPAATLKVLARHYQVDEFVPDEDSGPTPEQVRLAQLEQWAQTEAARQREAAVDATLVQLHQQYGDFDEDSLFNFAVERGVPDLETALRAMQYGHVAATRRTEKRSMAAVAGGAGRNVVAKQKAPPENINKFEDAYLAAKRELEMGN